ncbi:alpha/beta hydrolase [Candidatus Bathyarchaeota archaeon]|nr:alpha/beta hydrolase [Candidatus Bathyarchaeota archaeon]
MTTLYTPANGSAVVADIIFIHGLGSGSRKTWSYSGDESHYWPQSWLPSDPDFENVRIHAFGYAADWAERQQSALNITDFAQSFLEEVKNSPGIRRDATSIVLVGHSMGGCVAKKAYILARQDPSCRGLVAKSILSWVVLASRPLSTDELRRAIKLDIGQTMQNIARAVPSLCRQLVFIDQGNKAHIIHETAREFLLGTDLDSDLTIPEAHTHTRLSLLLVRYLSSNAMKVQSATEAPKQRARGFTSTRGFASTRGSASARSTPAAAAAAPDLGLLAYAAYFFSDHIYRCTSENDLLIEEFCLFLKSPNVLSWIEHISRGQDLSPLKRTATNLREYLRRRAKCVSPTDPQVHLVDGWVVDIIRVSAKFRSQLLACPSSIHCLIPPLCPPESNIFKSFSTETKPSLLVVENLPNGSWGDCLIRIDYTTKGMAQVVSHGDETFTVGFSTGPVRLYSSVSLQQVGEFSHPGYMINLLEFSPGCDYLVSGSLKHLVVWNVKTGTSMFSFGLQSIQLSGTFLSDGELLTASRTGELTKW